MASTLEIINGISQALSSNYDGALDEEGNPIKVGLKREEGHPINDSRIMDGFSVKMIGGNKLCVSYHGDVKLKEVHDKNFQSNIESMIADAVKFLKKEYKKATGSALSLTKEGECDMRVESTSRVRSWVIAKQEYTVSGMESHEKSSERKLDDSIRSWLELGGNNKRPQNDSRKKESFNHFNPSKLESGIRK